MNINPNKYYSAMAVKEILGVKARQTIIAYITKGILQAVKIGKKRGTRYGIKGEWLIPFVEDYKNNNIRYKRLKK
jgi:hypothetical protein